MNGLLERLLVQRQHLFDRPMPHQAAGFNPNRRIAQLQQNVFQVRHAQQDLALAPHLAQPFEALALEAAVSDDENLIDAGLDSIRVMGLIEDWKEHGRTVGFADLAADPTIRGFHAALEAAR